MGAAAALLAALAVSTSEFEFSWAANMSPAGMAVAVILEDVAFLSLFLSMESEVESDRDFQ